MHANSSARASATCRRVGLPLECGVLCPPCSASAPQASVLAHLPLAYRALVGHEAGVLDGPDMGTHVAAIPLEDLGELMLGGGDEPMDMPAGQAKILPYAAVRDLVLAGRVRLV